MFAWRRVAWLPAGTCVKLHWYESGCASFTVQMGGPADAVASGSVAPELSRTGKPTAITVMPSFVAGCVAEGVRPVGATVPQTTPVVAVVPIASVLVAE